MNYWIVRGDPGQKALTQGLRKGELCNWVTTPSARPAKWEYGDRCFMWRLAPEYSVVGLADLLGYAQTPNEHGRITFRLRYLTNCFATPVERSNFENRAAFANASFLKRGVAQTVLGLTYEQAFILYTAARALNPKVPDVWPDLTAPVRHG